MEAFINKMQISPVNSNASFKAWDSSRSNVCTVSSNKPLRYLGTMKVVKCELNNLMALFFSITFINRVLSSKICKMLYSKH